MKWVVVAILIAGAMIAGAIVYVARSNESRVFETDSAVEALDYQESGWSCEIYISGLPDVEDGWRPASENIMQPGYEPVSALQFYANFERSAGKPLNVRPDGPDIRCTEPGG